MHPDACDPCDPSNSILVLAVTFIVPSGIQACVKSEQAQSVGETLRSFAYTTGYFTVSQSENPVSGIILAFYAFLLLSVAVDDAFETLGVVHDEIGPPFVAFCALAILAVVVHRVRNTTG